MKKYVQISIRTRTDTIDWSVGEQFIDSLEKTGGKLTPEYVSHNFDRIDEPFLNKLSCENLWASKGLLNFNGASLDFYQDFAWKRKRAVRSAGSVVHTARNTRAQIVPGSISLTAAYDESVNWVELLRMWCHLFRPQLGMLHVFTGPELSLSERNSSFQIGSFDSAMNPNVPNMGWGMFYGDEFAKSPGVDGMSACGFDVGELGGGYLVRVTDEIQDVVDDFSTFSARRSELKRFFPEGFFLINDEPCVR